MPKRNVKGNILQNSYRLSQSKRVLLKAWNVGNVRDLALLCALQCGT